MKTIIAFLLCLTFVANNAEAQFLKGTTELSLSGTFGSFSDKVTSGSYSNSETTNYAVLDISAGYFLADGISVEPEIGWVAFQRTAPSTFLLANISYTMPNPSTNVSPFIRVGYGVSNALKYPGMGLIAKVSDKMDVGVFNFGGGIKYLVASDIALRMEVNYRKNSFSQTVSTPYFSSTSDITFATTSLLFGFSVLL